MDNLNFETYFLISDKKFLINVYDKKNLKSIFYNEKLNNNFNNRLNLNLINIFLDENIFKIEKLINGFVKNINLIIESDEFFPIDISIKKNNNGDFLRKDNLIHLLNEVKQECKNTRQDKKIIHMIIENYLIDGKKFFSFPNNLKCNFISLDIRFICLPVNYLYEVESIFRNYQIGVKHILNFSYVKSYLDEQGDLFNVASKIIDGHNENEVIIIPKKVEIKGFFERFFNYFS